VRIVPATLFPVDQGTVGDRPPLPQVHLAAHLIVMFQNEEVMKFYLPLILVLLVAGCANTSQVMKLGPDTFQVEATSHNIYGGGSPEAKNNALTSANNYCSQLGKEVLVTNIASDFERPFYRSTITFNCLDKSDPSLVRPSYEKEADIIIKNK
jgi:hypothetical protein